MRLGPSLRDSGIGAMKTQGDVPLAMLAGLYPGLRYGRPFGTDLDETLDVQR